MVHDDRTAILMEEMRGQFKAVLEVVVPLRSDMAMVKDKLIEHDRQFEVLHGQMSVVTDTLTELKADVVVLKADVSVLKADVKEMKGMLGGHDARISALEGRAI